MEHFCVTHVLNDTFGKRSSYVLVYKNIGYTLQKIALQNELVWKPKSPLNISFANSYNYGISAILNDLIDHLIQWFQIFFKRASFLQNLMHVEDIYIYLG